MRQVCQYHIIQFQPFAETGEFANIGIVLFAPRARRLLFKLLDPRQHGRITQFFEPLDGRLFAHVHHALQTELARLAEYPDAAVIEELTRPREDIIRYSPKRVLFADTEAFAQTVDGLFEYYVQQRFKLTLNRNHANNTAGIKMMNINFDGVEYDYAGSDLAEIKRMCEDDIMSLCAEKNIDQMSIIGTILVHTWKGKIDCCVAVKKDFSTSPEFKKFIDAVAWLIDGNQEYKDGAWYWVIYNVFFYDPDVYKTPIPAIYDKTKDSFLIHMFSRVKRENLTVLREVK